jgi:hypothetical protein
VYFQSREVPTALTENAGTDVMLGSSGPAQRTASLCIDYRVIQSCSKILKEVVGEIIWSRNSETVANLKTNLFIFSAPNDLSNNILKYCTRAFNHSVYLCLMRCYEYSAWEKISKEIR